MNNIKLYLAVAVVCFLSLLTSLTYAGNPCQIAPNGGIGGTGYLPEDGGIGGTGYAPTDGIGGTGKQIENGIGGTGDKLAVVGVVTGFASICVNGIEVHYDDTTAIYINGETTNSGQLAVGQLVSISAEKTPKGWNAVNIQSSDAVSGPVTKFTGPNRVEIAGQSVLLPKENFGSQIDKFTIGQHVRVQGIRMNNGEIFATSAAKTTRKDVAITGPIVRDVNGNMAIGKVNLGNLSPRFSENGQYVNVTGRLSGSTLIVRSARQALQVDSSANYLSIQSSVTSFHNGQLLLSNGTKIQTNRAFKAGSLLHINAYKDKNGLWQSLSISEQTHADLIKRAGERKDNSGKGNNKTDDHEEEKSDSGPVESDDDVGSNNSGSSSSDSSNNGSSNSGSSNSGSRNSSSNNSGSSNNRLSNDRSINSRSSSTTETLKVEKIEVPKIEKVEVPKIEKLDKIERIETPRTSDRIRSDERSGSGKGRNH